MTSLDQLREAGYKLRDARSEEMARSEVAAHQARLAFAEGHNVSEISRAAGVSRPTIYQWLREEEK